MQKILRFVDITKSNNVKVSKVMLIELYWLKNVMYQNSFAILQNILFCRLLLQYKLIWVHTGEFHVIFVNSSFVGSNF